MSLIYFLVAMALIPVTCVDGVHPCEREYQDGDDMYDYCQGMDLYDLDGVEENHEAFLSGGIIRSRAVDRLI